MKNALLDVSALDIDKKPDIDPNGLLAWLQSQGNVEDRRSLYGGQADTPNANLLAQWSMPAGLLGPGSSNPNNVEMGQELEDARLRHHTVGRGSAQVMPWNGPDDQAWRMAMSDQFQGREPKPYDMAGLGSKELTEAQILEKLLRELQERKTGGQGSDDSDLPLSPSGEFKYQP